VTTLSPHRNETEKKQFWNSYKTVLYSLKAPAHAADSEKHSKLHWKLSLNSSWWTCSEHRIWPIMILT